MKRVVAFTIKDSKMSSPTGTVKDPLESARSSHGAKANLSGRMAEWRKEEERTERNSIFLSVRASTGPEDVLVSLSGLYRSVRYELCLISVITEPTAAAFRVRWSTDMSHHLWPTALWNITGIFHIFLISLEVVQVTWRVSARHQSVVLH